MPRIPIFLTLLALACAARGADVTVHAARDGNVWNVQASAELDTAPRDACLLFFSHPLEMRLEVDEYPYERIVARAVSGSFKRMDGIYFLEKGPAGRTRLIYAGALVPDFYVPPLVGTLALMRHVERQFGALVDEIELRSATPPAAVSAS